MKQTKQNNESDIQAKKFLEKTNTIFECEFLKYDKHFEDDEEKRDIYKITLKRSERVHSFNFGNSINASGKYKVYTDDGVKCVNDLKAAKLLSKSTTEQKQNHSAPYRILENEDFKEPSEYDVLSCLQKYDVGTFKNFCDEFNYDPDSLKALKVYAAIINEYNNLKMLYSEKELEKLRKIQ